MNKYSKVIVLGAGFSKALCSEMPLIKDLFDNTDKKDLLGKFIDVVKNDLLGDFDVENFISYVLSKEIFFSSEEDMNFYSLRKKLLSFIYIKMKDIEPNEIHMNLMEKFLNHCIDNNIVLVSFNYDLFIEKTCKYLNSKDEENKKYNVLVDYGININKSPYNTSETIDCGCFNDRNIELLKLHGSFNWYNLNETENADCNNIILLDDEDISSVYSKTTPYYVPMSNTKYKYFEGNFYKTLWKKMNYYIDNAEKIDFIGYSFPKTDFDNLVLFSTNKSKVENIVVYEEAGNADRLKRIFNNATVHTKGAIDFLENKL